MAISKKTSVLSLPTIAAPDSDTNRDTQITLENAKCSSIMDRVSSFQALFRPGSSARGKSPSYSNANLAQHVGKFAPASQTKPGASCISFLSHSRRKLGLTGLFNGAKTTSKSVERSALQVPNTLFAAQVRRGELLDKLDEISAELKALKKESPNPDSIIRAAIASASSKVKCLERESGEASKVVEAMKASSTKVDVYGVMNKNLSFLRACSDISGPAPLPPWAVLRKTETPAGLRSEEIALVGAMRHPIPVLNESNDDKQKEYGEKFFAEVESAGIAIRDGEIQSIEELWQHATNWRYDLAVSSGHEEAENFKNDRDRNSLGSYSRTLLGGRYEYIKDRLKNEKTNELETRIVREPLAGVERVLTIIEDDRIVHTHSLNAKPIFHQVNSLAKDFLSGDHKNEAEAMGQLGTMHWWLANAMPNARGSGACAEVAIRAMAYATGRVLPPFKEGFISDLEAMTTDRKDFADSYKNSFDKG